MMWKNIRAHATYCTSFKDKSINEGTYAYLFFHMHTILPRQQSSIKIKPIKMMRKEYHVNISNCIGTKNYRMSDFSFFFEELMETWGNEDTRDSLTFRVKFPRGISRCM